MGAAAWVRVIVAEGNAGWWTLAVEDRRPCGQHRRHGLKMTENSSSKGFWSLAQALQARVATVLIAIVKLQTTGYWPPEGFNFWLSLGYPRPKPHC